MLKLNSETSFSVAKLGISLAWSSGMDSHSTIDCIELPGLEAAGIPAETLSDAALKKFHHRHPDFPLHAGRIIDQTLSQNILYAPKKMREDFARQLASLLSSAAARGFASASLDLGLEGSMEDKNLRQAAISIIRELAPTLIKAPLKLALPCRVPSLTKENYPAALAEFIKDCMIPGVKVSLEVHPHELPADFSAAAQIRGIEFDLALVTLMFSADSGNRIVRAHLEPWISLLGAYGFKGPYLICPKSGDRTRLPAECETLAKLIESIRKSPQKDLFRN